MSSPPTTSVDLPDQPGGGDGSTPLATTTLDSDVPKAPESEEGDARRSSDDKSGAAPGPSSPIVGTSPSVRADVDGLIASLRASLASSQALLSSQATRLSDLSDLEETHRQLKDQHAFLAAAKEAVEAQLRDEVKRREEAEERVEALRGQVEMARRGVMSLQKQDKERKRMSMMGPPAVAAAATGLGLQTGGGGFGGGSEEVLDPVSVLSDRDREREEKVSRRTSMMGRGSAYSHRRQSSQSEPEASLSNLLGTGSSTAKESAALSTSPNFSAGMGVPARAGLRELRLGGVGAGASTSPNPAQLPSPIGFDDPYTSTAGPRSSLSPPPAGASGSPSKARAAERAETERLRTELAATHLRLAESEEARQASETVLKALREFISASAGAGAGAATSPGATSGGVVDLNDPLTLEELKGISLPPLPTDRDPDEHMYAQHPEQKSKSSVGAGVGTGTGTWGFKLWNAKLAPPTPSSPAPSSHAVEPPATPHIASPPGSVMSNSTPRASPLPAPPSDLPLNEAAVDRVPAQTPLASFVSSWTRSVPPGTPAPNPSGAGGSGGTPQLPPPGATRSFSSFFRKTPATPDIPHAHTASRDKALPVQPASDAGSLGAERAAELGMKDESVEDAREVQSTAPMVGGGLEPSPVILNSMGDAQTQEAARSPADTEEGSSAVQEPEHGSTGEDTQDGEKTTAGAVASPEKE